MKYIDADRLKERVTRLIASTRRNDWPIAEDYLRRVIDTIDSLQQEQPEVELKKEVDNFWEPRFSLGWDDHSVLSMNHEGFVSLARHFYKLGLKAKKE